MSTPRVGRRLTLPDDSTFRLAEHTTVVLPEPPSGIGSLVNLLRGLIHVISRDPRRLSFATRTRTPGSKAPSSTSAWTTNREQTEVTVLEGDVSLIHTDHAHRRSAAGTSAVARSGQAPSATPLATPIDVMRWASYYPPIIAGALPRADEEPQANQQRLPDFWRAARRRGSTRHGSKPAEGDLAAALRLEPGHATALALETMIALARFDLATAQQRAAAALATDPHSVPALIAQSHVEQAANELRDATRTVERATRDRTEQCDRVDAARRARARTRRRAGEHPARAALPLSHRRKQCPSSCWALRRCAAETPTRRTQRSSARRDSSPTRLCRASGSHATATVARRTVWARRQLELAVVNDPANALARSYMAKQYEAEHRDELHDEPAQTSQKRSTPAIRRRGSTLRCKSCAPTAPSRRCATCAPPTSATAIAPCSARVCWLDEDLATRSAAIGRVHTELGFGRLALVDAWQAVADSPDNYAGHRLLADLYANEPRHEVARTSSLYIAQLLQPRQRDAASSRNSHNHTCSWLSAPARSQASFDEFASPVAANGLKLACASSSSAANGTCGLEMALAGLANRVAYGAGYYRFETDGFRENNDFDQEISERVRTIPAELRLESAGRDSSSAHGERRRHELFRSHLCGAPLRRIDEESDSLRLGAKSVLSGRDTLLVSAIYQDATGNDDLFPGSGVDFNRSGYSIDLRHLRSGEHVHFANRCLRRGPR